MNARRSVIMVAGASSTGKTTFALRYLLRAPVQWRFIFDTDGDFAPLLECAPAGTLSMCQWQLERSGWAIMDPALHYEGQTETALELFCQWAWDLGSQLPGQKLLVVDEVTRAGVDPWSIQPSLKTFAQAGRKKDFELLFITHEPNKTNGALMGQLTEAVSFQLMDDGAAEMRKKGFDAEALMGLPPGHFIARNCTSGAMMRGNLW